MFQIIHVEELATRLAEALVIGVVAYSFRLSKRVTRAEEKAVEVKAKLDEVHSVLKACQQSRTCALESVSKELATVGAVADQLTNLMVKVDTLLETGLRRIDMLEKHVFNL